MCQVLALGTLGFFGFRVFLGLQVSGLQGARV